MQLSDGIESFEHVGVLIAHLRLEWLLQHFSPRLVFAGESGGSFLRGKKYFHFQPTATACTD